MTSTRQRPMKVGLVLPTWEALPQGTPYWLESDLPAPIPRWTDILAFARQAEEAGFDSLWLLDHMLVKPEEVARQENQPTEGLSGTVSGVWEMWSLLAALAATTERITLGSFVSCTNYRNPALLAKIADTVDEISGGRLVLGLGAGDFKDEHDDFGMPWDRRVSRFEEALQIIVPLLRTGMVDFVGEHFQARDCELRPRGPRPGGPPILIGSLAQGPRIMRLVAQYADIWNGWYADFTTDPAVVPPLREAIDATCARVGRDPSTLGRSLCAGVVIGDRTIHGAEPLSGSPEELAASFRAFAREGIDHLQVWVNPMTSEGIDAIAEVVAILDRG